MKLTLILSLLFFFMCGSLQAAPPDTVAGRGEQPQVRQQMQDLQQRLVGDQEIMAMILTLQEDPEVQQLLNDPEVAKAVAAGDITALMANPQFMQLLNNPKVQEIQKRVSQ